MATPTIEAIATQDITIDTDYALEIGITNDPEEVTVGGLLEGFHYSWDADNDMLTIAGEATRLLGDAIWVVGAKETPSSTAVTREITYNVVLGAPIIEEVGSQTLYSNFDNDIFIEIQNRPTLIQVEGLLLGMKYEPDQEDAEDEGDDPLEGVRLTGTFPNVSNLTIDSTNFRVTASSDGGEDTYSVPITLSDGPRIYLVNELDAHVLQVTDNGVLFGTYEAPFYSGIQSYDPIVVFDDAFYLFNDSNDDLLKVSTDRTLLWTYSATTDAYQEMVVEDDGVYLFNTTDGDLLKISDIDGSLLWTYSDASNGSYSPPYVTSDGVYIFNSFARRLRKINRNTGVQIWSYLAPIAAFRPAVFIDDTIYLSHGGGENEIQKVNSSGALDWQGSPGAGSIVGVTPDYLYLFQGAAPRGLWQIDASDGSANWTYTTTLTGYDAYIAASDGFYLFDDGGTLWKVSVSGSLLWTYNAPDGIYKDPIVMDDGIYLFDDTSDNLLKVSTSGSLLWTYNGDSGFYEDVVVAGDYVYLFNDTVDDLHEIFRSDGSSHWTYNAPTGTYGTPVIVSS